jgi:ribosomal protein S12 methylthiotransferase accessory factor
LEIVVTLPGGKRVDAQAGKFMVRTDQPRDNGGEDSAPDPFTLFLTSLVTCAGFYVAAFCSARQIPTEEIRLVERTDSDPKTKRLTRVAIDIQLPPSFPPEYREAVVRAAATCKVKKVLAEPPDVEVHALPLGSPLNRDGVASLVVSDLEPEERMDRR